MKLAGGLLLIGFGAYIGYLVSSYENEIRTTLMIDELKREGYLNFNTPQYLQQSEPKTPDNCPKITSNFKCSPCQC